MGEVVPARTSLTLPPHPLALCCNYPVSKCSSASIVATSTLRVNIAKMNSQFLELHKDSDLANTKLSSYRYVFNTEFNLSFFRPKKDQCLTCTRFQDLQCPSDQDKKL